MTQKTTLPGIFTGPLVATLPKFIPAPPVESGLVRRYTAASLDSTQIGKAVDSLPDSTGMGAALSQADVARQPIARQAGSIRYLEFTEDTLSGDNSGGKCIAVVGRYRELHASGFAPIGALGGGGSGALSRTAAGKMQAYGSANMTTSLDPGSDWHVFIATFDGVNSVVQMDTVSVTGNAGAPPAFRTNLGAGTTGTTWAPVDVAEMLIWNRGLTPSERNRVVADLKANYGI